MYIFRGGNHEKGYNLYQLIEWFNLILPNRVFMNTEVGFRAICERQESEEDVITEETKSRARKVLSIFRKPSIQFSKQWRHYLTMQRVFTVLLTVYMIFRNDLFSILLMCFYLCYASLFALHVPYSFYNIGSWALSERCFFLTRRTVVILIRFLFQTDFISQYLVDGVWKFSGTVCLSLYSHVGPREGGDGVRGEPLPVDPYHRFLQDGKGVRPSRVQ